MTVNKTNFEFVEDKNFFEKLLCDSTSAIDSFNHFFDFRPVAVKRQEFNRLRKGLFFDLAQNYGKDCFLKYPDLCDISSGLAVDHLIPLSTNQLNKLLRNLKPEPGKKVKTQSFGSNHIDNLVIACNNCNNHKKHRLLDREKLLAILTLKTPEWK